MILNVRISEIIDLVQDYDIYISFNKHSITFTKCNNLATASKTVFYDKFMGSRDSFCVEVERINIELKEELKKYEKNSNAIIVSGYNPNNIISK